MPVKTKIAAAIRKYLLAGLLIWLPIWVTFVVIRFIVDLLDQTIALLPKQYQPSTLLGFHLPGFGVILTLIILFLTGLFVTNLIGNKLVKAWDSIVHRIPLVRGIYIATQQVVHALLNPTSKSFKKVLLIQWPRKGVWSVAFLTGDDIEGNIGEHDDMMTVFVPTTPNPTSGFLAMVPRKDTVELNIPIEAALKMVISLGVVAPDDVLPKNPVPPEPCNAQEPQEALS